MSTRRRFKKGKYFVLSCTGAYDEEDIWNPVIGPMGGSHYPTLGAARKLVKNSRVKGTNLKFRIYKTRNPILIEEI